MSLIAGMRLGPYEITGPLGSGGMGEVYRARNTKLGRDVMRERALPRIHVEGTSMTRSALLEFVGIVLLAVSLSGQDQAGYPRLPPPPVKSPPDMAVPDIPGVVVGGTTVHLIRDLFRSTEGPIAMPDGSFLFTEQDAGDGRLVRIGTNGEISTYVDDTNRTIGLAYDGRGRLIGTQSRIPRVGVLYPVRETLAEEFEGVPLIAPNDLVIDRKGGIYFTDPLGSRFRPVPAGRTTPIILGSCAPKHRLRRPGPHGVRLRIRRKAFMIMPCS